MTGLIVEEKVGFEGAQKRAFGQATEKHRLIDLNTPVIEGADGPLMSRRATGRDQRGANAHRAA